MFIGRYSGFGFYRILGITIWVLFIFRFCWDSVGLVFFVLGFSVSISFILFYYVMWVLAVSRLFFDRSVV